MTAPTSRLRAIRFCGEGSDQNHRSDHDHDEDRHVPLLGSARRVLRRNQDRHPLGIGVGEKEREQTPISALRYPLTAPSKIPRAMWRCSAAVIAMTGAIMITIKTDMYHHCGPRVPFCADTRTGMVWAFALERKSASRYSFQQRMST